MRPLSAEQRALVTLCYYQHLPRAEIASQLGLPAGTVKARIGQAMQVLRQRAQSMGPRQVRAAGT